MFFKLDAFFSGANVIGGKAVDIFFGLPYNDFGKISLSGN
jgi:hypothetical protein